MIEPSRGAMILLIFPSGPIQKAMIGRPSSAAYGIRPRIRRLSSGRLAHVTILTIPAPAPAQKTASPQAAEIESTLNAWAEAWSKKDSDAYLAFYAADFKPPKGEPRERWEKDRRARIAAPKSIAVSIASPRVTMEDGSHARVTFRQTYLSEVFKGSSMKTIVMAKAADGHWKIQQEAVGR